MKSLREKIESIVFAGLKNPAEPKGGARGPAAPTRRWGGYASGSITGSPAVLPPAIPLYLTKFARWGRKIRSWSVVAIPRW